jgi:hypothetical protein
MELINPLIIERDHRWVAVVKAIRSEEDLVLAKKTILQFNAGLIPIGWLSIRNKSYALMNHLERVIWRTMRVCELSVHLEPNRPVSSWLHEDRDEL